MKISEIGEFGLIELLAEVVRSDQGGLKSPSRQVILGIGDDAAAWQGKPETELATVDSFIQDVHFSLDITPWREIGWKALAVNLSDIAAMGGTPHYALVSLALPGDTEIDDVSALYRGMIELAGKHGVVIAGGDTSQSPQVAVNITVFGSAGGHVLTRSTAAVGDKIAVTGTLGAAAAGWEMLSRNLKLDNQPAARLSQAFLHPYPRATTGRLLVSHGVKTAIDISDGLMADLGHICQASQVSARIEADNIPIDPAVRGGFPDRALGLALAGGEDYELLFTANAETVADVAEAASCAITIIGDIIPGKKGDIALVDGRGNPVSMPEKGWGHFSVK